MSNQAHKVLEVVFDGNRVAKVDIDEKVLYPNSHNTNADTDNKPELGVLFVHGIGSQKRGETLPWAGDPLFKWLSSWYGRGKDTDEKSPNPYLTDARLTLSVPSEQDAPPFAQMKFRQADGVVRENDRTWIMAESWWADDFPPPTYKETVRLAVNVAPWIISQTGSRVVDALLDAVLDKSGLSGRKIWNPLANVLDSIGEFLFFLFRPIIRVIFVFIMLALGVATQLLVLALVVIALFPPLRPMAVKLQLSLAGWLGDAYLMATSPTRFTSMACRVQRDISWLVDKKECKEVAVIAHSGGAVVAHEALTKPGAPTYGDKRILLVTYGSGQSKVNSMRHMDRERNWFYNLSPLLRVTGVFAIVTALVILIVTENEHLKVGPIYVREFGGWLLLGGVLLNVAFSIIGSRILKRYKYKPLAPTGDQWIDYSAIADIVPDEGITATATTATATDEKGRRIQVTETANNLNSLLKDHGAYWQNGQEFVPEVARLLHAKARKEDLVREEGDQRVLLRARLRHVHRVKRFLAAGLLLIVSTPLLWMTLGSMLKWLGEPVRALLLNLYGGITQTAIKFVPEAGLDSFLGMVVVLTLIILFQKYILTPLWNWWREAERNAMFKRWMTDRGGQSRLRAGVFGIASAVVPVGTLIAIAFQLYSGAKIGIIESTTWLYGVIERLPIADIVIDEKSEWGMNALFWSLVFLSSVLAVTSIVNVFTLIHDLSSQRLLKSAEPDEKEREVFDRVLKKVLSEKPTVASPAPEGEQTPIPEPVGV